MKMRQHVFVQSKIIAFIVSLLLWFLLVGTITFDETVMGIVVSVVVVIVSGERLSILNGIRLQITTPIYLFSYLVYFFKALLLANFDVARRVLTPSLPINPAIVEIRTKLESPLARMLLANSITLTPGTLSVDMQGDRLLVHWIAVPDGYDSESAARSVAGEFERRISGFLV